MPERETKIKFVKMTVTPAEKRFIDYCRALKYAEMKLVVYKGEPQTAHQVMKSERFRLGNKENKARGDI